ncbi:MAG: SCO family protein [Betaproteobacteria bacterium]|nr:SCO family protein [Betaproteobacteria bacterium]MCL2885401.1 SCO family protein [Betaproteobacteria bacterium]
MKLSALFLLAALLAGQAAAQSAHEILLAERNEDIVPRYLLQDTRGRAVTSEDFSGRFQLLAFGYTYCPDICPTTLVEMAEVLQRLGDKAGRVQAIFVSVDPERDSAQVLQTYTEFFDRRILALTGSPALIRRAADNFRVRYAKSPAANGEPNQYAVDHSAGMYLIGPNGLFIRKFAYATPIDTLVDTLTELLAIP